jgi:hypothetical protein
MSSQEQGGTGCGTFVAIILVITFVFVAVISIAALVDPFSWVPPIGAIFNNCTDDPDTAQDECELATRYPGFWLHVLVNFGYALMTVGLLIALALAVPEFRKARTARFDNEVAVDRYRRARQRVTLVAVLLAVVAATPIIAALA